MRFTVLVLGGMSIMRKTVINQTLSVESKVISYESGGTQIIGMQSLAVDVKVYI